MIRVQTIWLPSCLFQIGLSVLLLRVENEDIWFLAERDWSQMSFHDNDVRGFFCDDISGAKCEEHCFYISRDILC